MANTNTNRAATKLEIGAAIRRIKGMSISTLEIAFKQELLSAMTIVGTYSWMRDAKITAMSMILDGRAAKLGLV